MRRSRSLPRWFTFQPPTLVQRPKTLRVIQVDRYGNPPHTQVWHGEVVETSTSRGTTTKHFHFGRLHHWTKPAVIREQDHTEERWIHGFRHIGMDGQPAFSNDEVVIHYDYGVIHRDPQEGFAVMYSHPRRPPQSWKYGRRLGVVHVPRVRREFDSSSSDED